MAGTLVVTFKQPLEYNLYVCFDHLLRDIEVVKTCSHISTNDMMYSNLSILIVGLNYYKPDHPVVTTITTHIVKHHYNFSLTLQVLLYQVSTSLQQEHTWFFKVTLPQKSRYMHTCVYPWGYKNYICKWSSISQLNKCYNFTISLLWQLPSILWIGMVLIIKYITLNVSLH